MKKLLAFMFIVYGSSFIVLQAQTISTIAGNFVFGGGYGGDGGPATAAELHQPSGLAVDASGNLYIADFANSEIRKVSTSGIISTVAGNYLLGSGYQGDGGPATSAELDFPLGVGFDASGNMYVADGYNYEVRKVNTSGIITRVAGNRLSGFGYSGDGGPATAAELDVPGGVAFDVFGNLYIADLFNNLTRKVDISGNISTVAGDYAFGPGYSGDGGPATSAELYYTYDIAFNSSNEYLLADWANHVIRKVDNAGVISTIAGNHIQGYSGDGGPASTAELNSPAGIAIDALGNIYIADYSSNVVRKVNTSGVISPVAGNFALGSGYTGDGGPATAARLFEPYGLAVDASGNLYIADYGNNVIREVTGITTGSTELSNEDKGLIVYPNPSTGLFTFQLSNFEHRIMTIEVYNVLGQKVTFATLKQFQGDKSIDISDQPNGFYFYRATDENGALIGEGKLIIEK